MVVFLQSNHFKNTLAPNDVRKERNENKNMLHICQPYIYLPELWVMTCSDNIWLFLLDEAIQELRDEGSLVRTTIKTVKYLALSIYGVCVFKFEGL